MKEISEDKPTQRELTARALVIGALGSALITTSSMYVALKLGALPWPIIFVAMLSLALLKAMGNTNLHEVNVAHTAMSAGAMIAGGVAFTIPGLWIIDPTLLVSWPKLVIAVLSGTVLGLIFSALIRKHFIDNQDLPYPMGQAAAETLMVTDAGGKQAGMLFGAMGISGVLVVIRDYFKAIPSMLFPQATLAGIPMMVYFSPMMMSVGYMVGLVGIGVWVLGALIGHFGILALLPSVGVLTPEAAASIKSSLGIGLMLGCGLGVLIKNILPKAAEIFKPLFSKESQDSSIIPLRWAPLAIVVIVAITTFVLKMGIVASLILILGSWIAVTMAAQSVGDTSIDPMEVFAVIMLLIARAVTGIAGAEAFMFAAIIAVACGLAGDVMSDFKAGKIIGTSPRAQWFGQVAGALVGVFVSVGVLYLLVQAYGTDSFGMNKEFVAVQASVVASMVSGVPHVPALVAGLVIGAALYVLGLPVMTLGLGVYLPLYLTLTAAIGGVVKLVSEKIVGVSKDNQTGLVIASGVIGGEAVVSVVIALITVVAGLSAL